MRGSREILQVDNKRTTTGWRGPGKKCENVQFKNGLALESRKTEH